MTRPILAASRFPPLVENPESWTKGTCYRNHSGLARFTKKSSSTHWLWLPETSWNFFYEARLDWRWRLIMRIDSNEIILFDILNHDEVKRLSR